MGAAAVATWEGEGAEAADEAGSDHGGPAREWGAEPPVGEGWGAANGEWSKERGSAPRFPWGKLKGGWPRAEAGARVVEEPPQAVTHAEQEDIQRARRVAFARAVVAARWDHRPRGTADIWRAEAGMDTSEPASDPR